MQRQFAEEKKQWTEDDQRINDWLVNGNDPLDYGHDALPGGADHDDAEVIVFDDVEGDDDDGKEEDANLDGMTSAEFQPSDFITILVDDRVFRTYRHTMTQVAGSKLAAMFSGKWQSQSGGVVIECIDGVQYVLDYNAQTFSVILDVLRHRFVMPDAFELTPAVEAGMAEFGVLEYYEHVRRMGSLPPTAIVIDRQEFQRHSAAKKTYYNQFPSLTEYAAHLSNDGNSGHSEIERLTNEVLQEKPSGDPGNRDTLLHVLHGLSADSGRKCFFYDSSKNIQPESKHDADSYLHAADNEGGSKFVLSLESLDDVVAEEKYDESRKLVELKTAIR